MRLIDAEKLKNVIEGTDWHHISLQGNLACGARSDTHTPLYKADDIYKALEEAPTVDAAPVVHGRWIQTDKADIVWRECSACGERRLSTWFGKTVKSFNYCPKCGAKMDAEDKP